MTTLYKLRVKVGQAEFEAEGPEDVVKDQFDLFMGCLSDSRSLSNVLKMDLPKPSKNGDGKNGDHLQGGQNRDSADPTHIERIMERVFKVDDNKIVSLRMMPQTESKVADSMLLILYGYQQLNNCSEVQTTSMTTSAKQSGVHVDRISKAISQHRELVTAGGSRKSARYALNNRGIARAEELLEAMFE